MPKIPDLFVPSVSENPARIPAQQLQPITPFQSQLAPQMQQLGQALEAAGTGFARAYDVILDDENDAIAKDLDLQLKMKLDQELEDPDNGFFAKTGPQAGSKAYNDIVNNAYKIVDDSMAVFNDGNQYGNSSYKVAQGMYRNVAMQRLEAFKTRASEHARGQIRQYADQMSEARWIMHSDDAAKFRSEWNATSPDGKPTNFQRSLIAARTEAQTIATRKVGTAPENKEVFDFTYKQKIGQTHSAVITNFLLGEAPDVDSATKYLETYGGEMLEQDRVKLNDAIQDRKPVAQGFKIYREVLANPKLTTLEDQRRHLDEMVEKDPSKQAAADHAFDRLREFESIKKKDSNATRASVWSEFVQLPQGAVTDKNFTLWLRENPQWATKLEENGLTDNAQRYVAKVNAAFYSDAGQVYLMKSGQDLALEFDTESELRNAIASELKPSMVESVVKRWAAFHKNATEEQRREGKSFIGAYQYADVSLQKQGYWKVHGGKDEATKAQAKTEYTRMVEDRLKTKLNRPPTEVEMIEEMERIEEKTFVAINQGVLWDDAPVSIGIQTMQLDASKLKPTYDVYRFNDGGSSVLVKVEELRSPIDVQLGTSKETYTSMFEAMNAYNSFLVRNKRKAHDLSDPEGFYAAYKAVKQISVKK